MRWLPVAVALGVSCGHHAPPPPPHSEGVAIGPDRMAPNPPWSVTYADGSGNVYVLHDDGGGAEFSYDPVTPAESSSGTYSGGEPRHGRLDDATTDRLWGQVLALEGDTANHATERAMMTGAFKVSDNGAEYRSFILQPSPALTAFDQFVSALR